MGDFDVAEFRRRFSLWDTTASTWNVTDLANGVAGMAGDAADEIDRLRAEVATLKHLNARRDGLDENCLPFVPKDSP